MSNESSSRVRRLLRAAIHVIPLSDPPETCSSSSHRGTPIPSTAGGPAPVMARETLNVER